MHHRAPPVPAPRTGGRPTIPGREHLAILRMLASKFPKVFSTDMKVVKPLKRGIHDDLLAALEGTRFAHPDKIQAFLDRYTRQLEYHVAVWREQWRYDLNGIAVEEIPPHHKDLAAARGQGALRRWQTTTTNPTP